MSKQIQITIFLLLLTIIMVGQSLAVLAQTATSSPEAPISLTNPIGTVDISAIIGRIIAWVLRFLGVLALVMFIYGGILWMTSGGDEGQIKKGRETLVWAVAGLALVFFSYAILNFVLKVLMNQ